MRQGTEKSQTTHDCKISQTELGRLSLYSEISQRERSFFSGQVKRTGYTMKIKRK